ncbi:hypothetical protein QZH41_018412, partial [Actinostola sp. cb2023]
VHVSRFSRVTDHCSQYALSDSQDPAFKNQCDHIHDVVCERCEELKSVLSGIQKAVTDSPMLQSEKEDALYTCQEAISGIRAWKAHQLRLVNQDKARIDVIDELCDEDALIIQDWAMKFLPRTISRVSRPVKPRRKHTKSVCKSTDNHGSDDLVMKDGVVAEADNHQIASDFDKACGNDVCDDNVYIDESDDSDDDSTRDVEDCVDVDSDNEEGLSGEDDDDADDDGDDEDNYNDEGAGKQ